AVVADIGDFMLRRVEADELAGLDEPAARPAGETAAELAAPVDLRGEVGIRPAEGAEAFVRALGSDFGPQVAVTALDLRTLLVKVRQLDRNRVDEDSPASHADGAEAPAGEYVAPSTELERTFIQLWEEAMGIKGIGIEHNFFELGGNSLVAAQLIARVRTLMGIKLPMRTIFQSPTVAGMAASLEASAEAVS
ncbi:MAG TPA: phosphopantetheine-binding protein, partial [Candidatus Lustribacter sp.]|nr:phosphopantetheine-binding protein [Candidatus Lustribacter sp.]